MRPLGKVEGLADRVSSVVKVTQQAGGPVPAAAAQPGWGGLAPRSPPHLHLCVELWMSDLDVFQASCSLDCVGQFLGMGPVP